MKAAVCYPGQTEFSGRKGVRMKGVSVRSKALAIAVVAGCGALVLPPVANADRAEPVPIYRYYDAFLDHEHQTFNGTPIPSDSAVQLGSFNTHCDVNGVHRELAARDRAHQ
jgi:hypothetical protein